jgi:hypothetical protein
MKVFTPFDAVSAGLALTRLGIEAQGVIWLRGLGAAGAWNTPFDEGWRAMREKPDAFAEAMAAPRRPRCGGRGRRRSSRPPQSGPLTERARDNRARLEGRGRRSGGPEGHRFGAHAAARGRGAGLGLQRHRRPAAAGDQLLPRAAVRPSGRRGWTPAMPPRCPPARGGRGADARGQLAWITYRGHDLRGRGGAMRGGSGEPMLRFGCLARLTEARARELRDFTRSTERKAG